MRAAPTATYDPADSAIGLIAGFEESAASKTGLPFAERHPQELLLGGLLLDAWERG